MARKTYAIISVPDYTIRPFMTGRSSLCLQGRLIWGADNDNPSS
jgi:hypothetical protein